MSLYALRTIGRPWRVNQQLRADVVSLTRGYRQERAARERAERVAGMWREMYEARRDLAESDARAFARDVLEEIDALVEGVE